jgi:cytochrome P450
VHAEQDAVASKYGPTLTPAAYAAMPYTIAVIKETLRLAQIISVVPRLATKDLPVPGGPTLRAGCPFLINLEAISKSDPAVQQTADWEQFKPQR